MNVSPELAGGAVLVAGSVAAGPLAVRAAFRLRPGRNVFFASWGFGQALVALIAMILVGWLAPRFLTDLPVGGASILAIGAGCLVAFHAARRAQREPVLALGLAPEASGGAALLVGPLVALMAVPAGIGASMVSAELGAGPSLRAVHLAGGLDPVSIALFLLIGPLVTELWFRGFLQPLLVQNFSERGGVVLSALLFAAIHGLPDFLPAFALGLALSLAKLRTQSTWSAFLGSVTWNAVAFALAAAGAQGIGLPLLF